MINEVLQTPKRRKTIHDCLSDPRYKYSTVESHISKDSRAQRGINHDIKSVSIGVNTKKHVKID